ncbi:uncharacterized protein BO87DRAFT_378037 [Aspergillus neoniger CBS 115656]|uniref:Uncharacterized protein n=1 Tax=Aspergillus neoniger (strain CBS 115656) TaxID=1448310 RepID=A0A318YFV6_ASPNB|nr:hypothetical protein BO87DRAFT_378037 [Aspergillus neoniger CBS 115656]PYH32537.1 hypothetical protein BO87DRAFT_378037 [Aspergillus neoniger CBS 115656]
MNYNQPEFFYAPENSNVFLVTLLTYASFEALREAINVHMVLARWVGMAGSSWFSSLVTMLILWCVIFPRIPPKTTMA